MRIGYARVSTIEQNLDLQTEKLKQAGCTRIITEKASGAKVDRPELTRLLRDILREGDTLVVWKLDRLARSLKQLIATADDLKARGIELASVTDQLDTASPGGMLVFHMLGAIAEFERGLIRERTMAGLAEARRRGRRGGRPRSMSAKDIAAAQALLTGDVLTAQEVASRFNVARSTLYRCIAEAKGLVPRQRLASPQVV
ncbi:recombinase family protein [Methylobacterium soli]|uniref:Recombinase family protein n=1 Tax=Methylobacterium soli TaxID=553447 RepID=A0A6L3SRB7_9HYPH|nr:recombinase family protein [Methylobacterium soli]KAB1068898.1 recombinase family protein [Methylobacterium soli]GJE43977.1 DNA-invertase hin [Methylobacterium soli]